MAITKVSVLKRKKDGQVFSAKCQITESSWERMRGLLGRSLESGESLWIEPCNSVHTFFMKYDIDVIFLRTKSPGHAEVIRLYEKMKPWRFSPMVWRANAVLEMPAGTCEKLGLKVGEELWVSS